MPVGVKGLRFAASLSEGVGTLLEDRVRCLPLSKPIQLRSKIGSKRFRAPTGVNGAELFSRIVLGVAGESINRSDLTLLYGGESVL